MFIFSKNSIKTYFALQAIFQLAASQIQTRSWSLFLKYLKDYSNLRRVLISNTYCNRSNPLWLHTLSSIRAPRRNRPSGCTECAGHEPYLESLSHCRNPWSRYYQTHNAYIRQFFIRRDYRADAHLLYRSRTWCTFCPGRRGHTISQFE